MNVLPLVEPVGSALLDYLAHARPETTQRRLFVRHTAPRDLPLTSSGFVAMVKRRLAQVGVLAPCCRNPHGFRYARALSLLRSGASLKMIGDVLGHRSAEATHIYLKLPSSELRGVALDLPGEA